MSNMFQLISAMFCSKKCCFCICWLDLDRETAHFVFSKGTNFEIKRSNMYQLSTTDPPSLEPFYEFLSGVLSTSTHSNATFPGSYPQQIDVLIFKNISPQRSQTFHPPTPPTFGCFFSPSKSSVFSSVVWAP